MAVPCASKALPCGMEAMRATLAVSGGASVFGTVTPMPGSMCSAPPVVESLIS